MPDSFSFGKIQFDVSLGRAAGGARREAESPFLLAVLGDFTGRTGRSAGADSGAPRPVRVDCDNFDSVMKRLEVALRLPAPRQPGGLIELRFECMEDFHPEALLKKVPSLAALLSVYEQLGQPASATAAVQEARKLLSVSVEPAVSPAPSVAAGESVQETMARLLGGTPPPAPGKPPATGLDIHALIKDIVAPSVVPGATPEQAATRSAVEVDLAAQLRAMLHHPAFQRLESAWRGLELLVREFGAEENLQLHLLDVSKEELLADLGRQENLPETALFQSLREQDWAALLGLYTFAESVPDIEALGRMAKMASALNASFVAGAGAHFPGCDSLTAHPDPGDWTRVMPAESRAAWAALRALPEATHLGLVLPRVLLRQPYGKGSDAVERFPFEELSGEAAHESFLWGGGAIVCGWLLAAAFRAEGWAFTASGSGELEELPVYKFTQDGETVVKPCAEVWLTDRAGERILEQGLMPLLSIKGRGAVRLANVQSVAAPLQPLFLRQA
jgi:type VI secretion system protein ImpC